MKNGGGSGPTWLKELGVTVLWSAAAVNVFIFTFKAAFNTQTVSPLLSDATGKTNNGNILQQGENQINKWADKTFGKSDGIPLDPIPPIYNFFKGIFG